MNGHHHFIHPGAGVQLRKVLEVVYRGVVHSHVLTREPDVSDHLARHQRNEFKAQSSITSKLVGAYNQHLGRPSYSQFSTVETPKKSMDKQRKNNQDCHSADEQRTRETDVPREVKSCQQYDRCRKAGRPSRPGAGSLSKEFINVRDVIVFGRVGPDQGTEYDQGGVSVLGIQY